MGVLLRGEDRDFVVGLDVAKRELHRETVHLRLGKRIGAAEFDGVLRGNDKKQIGEIAPFAIDADLAFAHGFEQRRLGAGRGAVDFVGEQDVCKDRTFVEVK
jgi:hypothetical protein